MRDLETVAVTLNYLNYPLSFTGGKGGVTGGRDR